VLHFPYKESREPDKKDIERFKKLFRGQGAVSRLDLRNYIPAIIDQQELVNVMAASGVSAESLLADPRNGYLKLNFPACYRLACLYKRHRVLAGAEILPLGDKRWTVDLYLNSIFCPA
jgi:Protein of unknown function (DUF3723)